MSPPAQRAAASRAGQLSCGQVLLGLPGAATAQTWIKIAVTYLVPFTVANIGLLLGSRRPSTTATRAGRGGGVPVVDQD